MKAQTKISIIGFGEVGTIVASSINTRFDSILLNILDSSTEISGRILDFSNACAVNQNEVFVNDELLLLESDYVIYCAGFANKKGHSRNEVAQNNYDLVKNIFEGKRFNANTVIIVVTNPVELVSRWIYETIGQSNLVIGTGTSLDTIRLNDLISDSEDRNVTEINTLLLGEHGDYLVPILSQSTILGKEINNELSSQKIDFYLEKVKSTATQIRETEKATKFGVAECVLKILKGFILGEKVNLPFSVLVNDFYQEKLKTKGLNFLSLPCEIIDFNLKIRNLDFSEKEDMALLQALKHLELINQGIKI